jgi:hypothetical protein
MDEDQLYRKEPPYKPRRVLETALIEWLATYLEELSIRRDVGQRCSAGHAHWGCDRH